MSEAFCQISFFFFVFCLSFHFQLPSFLLHPLFHLQTCPKIFLEYRAARHEDQRWMFLLALPLHLLFLPTPLGDFSSEEQDELCTLSPLFLAQLNMPSASQKQEKKAKLLSMNKSLVILSFLNRHFCKFAFRDVEV